MDVDSEIEQHVAALTDEDWAELQDLCQEVLAHKGEFSTVGGGEVTASGAMQMHYTIEAPVVTAVRECLYGKGLVVPFDWPHWKEGKELFGSAAPDKYSGIPVRTVIKLLTAVIRADRFSDGAFANLFKSGDAAKLLERLLSFRPTK